MTSNLTRLGRRERQIVDVVIRLGRASAVDVLRELPDAPALSTVRTMLRLLEGKGYLRHEWEGPRFVYSPTSRPEALRKAAVRHMLRTFFEGSIASAVASLLGSAPTPVTDEELERAAGMIDAAQRRARRQG